MRQNPDSGTSSAAAFLLILAVFLTCAGLFAAVALPLEEKKTAEQEADAGKTVLSETIFLMRGAADAEETKNLRFSTLFPKGTLTAELNGYLVINSTYSIPLNSISLETGRTTQGIIAGGIWRKDGVDAAWILFPKTAYDSGVVSLELFTLSGNPAYGSNTKIPVTFSSTRQQTQTFSGNTITLAVISEDAWVRNLWKTFFYEIGFFEDIIIKTISTPDRITAELSAEEKILTLQLKESFFSISAGEDT